MQYIPAQQVYDQLDVVRLEDLLQPICWSYRKSVKSNLCLAAIMLGPVTAALAAQSLRLQKCVVEILGHCLAILLIFYIF